VFECHKGGARCPSLRHKLGCELPCFTWARRCSWEPGSFRSPINLWSRHAAPIVPVPALAVLSEAYPAPQGGRGRPLGQPAISVFAPRAGVFPFAHVRQCRARSNRESADRTSDRLWCSSLHSILAWSVWVGRHFGRDRAGRNATRPGATHTNR